MDTEQVEQVAQHLTSLGCTREQIERHLKPLRSAAARAAKQKPKPKPPTHELTQEQIDLLLAKLRQRQWRWCVWQHPQSRTEDWVGHAILAVTGMPEPKSHSHASFLIGHALAQLRELGLIARVSNGLVARGERAFLVQVVEKKPQRKPRERLDHAERCEREALTGMTAASHS